MTPMKRLQAYPFRLGPDEDLKGRNMSRSAAGTLDQPGKNVRAKSGFNKSILDQGWFEFRRQLDYKLSWNGGWLVAVPPKNTSCECPCCGYVSADNRRKQSRFAWHGLWVRGKRRCRRCDQHPGSRDENTARRRAGYDGRFPRVREHSQGSPVK